MHIDYNILIAYGGIARKIEKNQFVFMEGEQAHYYHQIIEGKVKIFSTNSDGKELIQGIYTVGESFGEPPVFICDEYSYSAQTMTTCVLVKITLEKIQHLLNDYPETTQLIIRGFAQKLYHKDKMVQMWGGANPEEKILLFIEQNCSKNSSKKSIFPYTRQQIADFTGLRVETVIRTLSKMNKEGKVSIIQHKLYI
jgi:CRP/FNR family transcriptional regulator